MGGLTLLTQNCGAMGRWISVLTTLDNVSGSCRPQSTVERENAILLTQLVISGFLLCKAASAVNSHA